MLRSFLELQRRAEAEWSAAAKAALAPGGGGGVGPFSDLELSRGAGRDAAAAEPMRQHGASPEVSTSSVSSFVSCESTSKGLTDGGGAAAAAAAEAEDPELNVAFHVQAS